MDTSRLSPAAYLLALLCFLMPFVELSCQGQELATFTGLQVATGASVKEPRMFGPPQEKTLPPDIVVLAALAAAGAGLLLSLGKGGASSQSSGVAGLSAAILLLVFKSRTDSGMLSQGGGLIQVQYGLGFWGATLLSAVAAVIAFMAREGSRSVAEMPVLEAGGTVGHALTEGAQDA